MFKAANPLLALVLFLIVFGGFSITIMLISGRQDVWSQWPLFLLLTVGLSFFTYLIINQMAYEDETISSPKVELIRSGLTVIMITLLLTIIIAAGVFSIISRSDRVTEAVLFAASMSLILAVRLRRQLREFVALRAKLKA